ncbi:MAG: copper chaperone [Desulfobacteraceae bacterium]|nr:MAG: copper chaperone [Desulfobacteraceae bacterium]
MEKRTFSIPNISCGHCTMSIKNELSEIEGVSRVEGDIEKKTVTVEWGAPATYDRIVGTLKEINYPPSE